MSLWHWLLNVTGSNTAGTRWNLAWSGFLSAGVISTGLIASTLHRARAANCNAKGCWRIGTHDYVDKDAVKHRYCRHCHPILKGRHHTREQIQANHKEAPVDVEIEVEEENPFAHGSEERLLFEIQRELKRIGAVVRKIADVIAPTPSGVTITLIPDVPTHKP